MGLTPAISTGKSVRHTCAIAFWRAGSLLWSTSAVSGQSWTECARESSRPFWEFCPRTGFARVAALKGNFRECDIQDKTRQ